MAGPSIVQNRQVTGPAAASAAPASAMPAVGADGVTLDGLRRACQDLARSRREPDWLRDFRLEALEVYAAEPLPDRVSHLWRYTDPEKLLPAVLPSESPPRTATTLSGEWPEEIAGALASGSLAGAALVSGGRLARSQLDPALVRAGVVIEDLHLAAESRKDLVREHLGSLIPSTAGKFEALNAALWRGGLLVHVPKGVEVTRPIHLLFQSGGEAASAPRLLVVTGPASALTIIDEHVSASEEPASRRGPVHAVVENLVGQDARLSYLAVQRLGRTAALHLTQRGRLASGARMLSSLASLGAGLAKADIGTRLEGRGAEVELLGFLFGQGRQHFDHHTVHHHRAPDTRSNLDFKVVLKDRSRSAYTGLIRIDPDALRSEAYQENRNLLLSEGAKVDSIPELEILTDEVMCTHGATMGSLDPDHLFYLRSRGIPLSEAKRMIVAGFMEPTLTRLPGELQSRLRAHLESGMAEI